MNLNPAAKEFVPAHILRKREEEARLNNLAQDIAQVDLNDTKESNEPQQNGSNKQQQLKTSPNKNCSNKVQNVTCNEKSDSSLSSTSTQLPATNQNSTSVSQNKPLSYASAASLKAAAASAVANQANKQTADNSASQGVQNNPACYNNNHADYNNDQEYQNEYQQFVDETNEHYLLNEGEGICEFNGEQFIVPNEAEFNPNSALHAGYDFGSNEDNENEDICNEFENFLDNLPS